MSTDPNKRQVQITNSKSGEIRLSEPIPVHGAHKPTPEASGEFHIPEAITEHLKPSSAEPAAVSSESISAVSFSSALVMPNSTSLDSPPPSGGAIEDARRAVSGQKAGRSGTPKPEIENLEQFITHAYSRKGQRVNLKPKNERLVTQNSRLDDGAIIRLQTLADADALLTVPRQLLLVSREVEALPGIRAALNAFVSKVMLRHPIFANDGVQAAMHNLPDAPPMVVALSAVANCKLAEVAGTERLKSSDLQTLRRNGVHLLAIWFAFNRGLNFEEMAALLFQVLWEPATHNLVNDNARLRALTEMEQLEGVGVVCHRLRQQAIEARTSQDQAQREAAARRQQVAELDDQLQKVQAERESLVGELGALRTSSADEFAKLRAQHEAERIHLRHELEQLRGRLVRRLNDGIEMLEVGLTALRNKTPRTEVMAERAEHVVDALRAELTNLTEE